MQRHLIIYTHTAAALESIDLNSHRLFRAKLNRIISSPRPSTPWMHPSVRQWQLFVPQRRQTVRPTRQPYDQRWSAWLASRRATAAYRCRPVWCPGRQQAGPASVPVQAVCRSDEGRRSEGWLFEQKRDCCWSFLLTLPPLSRRRPTIDRGCPCQLNWAGFRPEESIKLWSVESV